MEFTGIIVGILLATFIVVGIIAMILRAAVFSSTEGAVTRLNEEIAKTSSKQAELNEKLRIADEELAKTRAEAKSIADKMRTEAEESSKAERDKIITAARQEAEEVIAKAHNAEEKLKVDLEKKMDSKAVQYGMTMLNQVLSEQAKGAFDKTLTEEFIKNLETTDMDKISSGISEVELVVLNDIDEQQKNRILSIIKEKTKRDMTAKVTSDPELGGGIIIKFGSMSLDGSIRNLLREAALREQAKVDARV